MDEARATYLKQVETAFVRLRGRGLMLSPKDVALVERWRNSGIPVHVVLRALEEAVTEYVNRHPASSTLPSTLAYFERRIDDAATLWRGRMLDWEQVDEAVAGPSKEATLKDQFAVLIVAIETSGQRCAHEGIRGALRRAWKALNKAQAAEQQSPWELAGILDEQLIQWVLEVVEVSIREDLEQQAEERAIGRGTTMSAEARRDRLNYQLALLVRERWGLPELVEVMRESGL